jgi:hypothetical protein
MMCGGESGLLIGPQTLPTLPRTLPRRARGQCSTLPQRRSRHCQTRRRDTAPAGGRALPVRPVVPTPAAVRPRCRMKCPSMREWEKPSRRGGGERRAEAHDAAGARARGRESSVRAITLMHRGRGAAACQGRSGGGGRGRASSSPPIQRRWLRLPFPSRAPAPRATTSARTAAQRCAGLARSAWESGTLEGAGVAAAAAAAASVRRGEGGAPSGADGHSAPRNAGSSGGGTRVERVGGAARARRLGPAADAVLFRRRLGAVRSALARRRRWRQAPRAAVDAARRRRRCRRVRRAGLGGSGHEVGGKLTEGF